MGQPLALSGFLIVNAATLQYLTLIGKEKVPDSWAAHAGVMVLGAVVAVVGAGLGATPLTVGLAALTVVTTIGMIYLFSLAPLPDGALVARVGEPVPELVAPDQDGGSFDLASLQGRRVMVKFFRGSW